MQQPRINWWPGNLRPYESEDCFLARFSALNGVAVKQSQLFFRDIFNRHVPTSAEDIAWVAACLQEPLSVVQTVLAPIVRLDTFGEFAPKPGKSSGTVRYCSRCVEQGYHSSLHELGWLKKCAFHGEDLHQYSGRIRGALIAARTRNIQDLLSGSNCEWARAQAASFELVQSEMFQCFIDWLGRVRVHANFLHKGNVLSLDSFTGWVDQSYEQVLGQLNAFVPIPAQIRPLFLPFKEQLAVEMREFPKTAKNEFTRFTGDLHFLSVYRYFKYICSYAPRPRPFNRAYVQAREALIRRHGDCCCEWVSYRSFGQPYWDFVGDDGRFHLWKKCPFAVALEEFASEVGQDVDVDRPRLNQQRRDAVFQLSRELKDHGLIGYTPNANISPEGYAYQYPQVWPCFEWCDNSILTELFDAIAEFEVGALYEKLSAWLDYIDAGGNPRNGPDLHTHIHIHATDSAVTLIRWYQKKSHPEAL